MLEKVLEIMNKNKKERKQHLRYRFRSWRAARDTVGCAALRARRPLLRSSTRLTLRG
jgi:hypothetical protein